MTQSMESVDASKKPLALRKQMIKPTHETRLACLQVDPKTGKVTLAPRAAGMSLGSLPVAFQPFLDNAACLRLIAWRMHSIFTTAVS
jgi:hypothetical protein